MAGTLICYGDSNTYGYDPRSFLGGRYPANRRWPELLAAETGWTVFNFGQNGRTIPDSSWEIRRVTSYLPQWAAEKEPVWLWIMLGTNDLLQSASATAETVTERMERFLRELLASEEVAGSETGNQGMVPGQDKGEDRCGKENETSPREDGRGLIRLRLIAPVHLCRGEWVDSDVLCRESEKLDELYLRLAERLGIACTCAGAWDIPVMFDGVHFSEEGHRKFADCMKRELQAGG